MFHILCAENFGKKMNLNEPGRQKLSRPTLEVGRSPDSKHSMQGFAQFVFAIIEVI